MQHKKKIRIAYLSGLVDAEKVYETWSISRHSRSLDTSRNYFGTIYLSQFYEICSELDAEVYVITTRPAEYSCCRLGNAFIENRPEPKHKKGILFHLAVLIWFIRFLPKLIRFAPDVLVITAFQNHWFLLSFLRWMGVSIVPAIHNGFWPKFQPIRLSWRISLVLNRVLLLKHIKAAIAVSDDAGGQLRLMVGDSNVKIFVFNATYARDQFLDIPPPNIKTAPPFRVLFVGRIETNKGVFDLLNIAARLEKERKGDFSFDICGDGPEFGRLRNQVEKLGLQNVFICHGWSNASTLQTLLAASHAVVIPTTTEFEEGFPKVYAEAILAGRPVVTSAVCITKLGVEAAAIEVPPDDVNAYHQAIQRLYDDREMYEEKRRACFALQERFYDTNNSYGAKLRKAIAASLSPHR